MAFSNILIKEYLNLLSYNGQNCEMTPLYYCLHQVSDLDPDPDPQHCLFLYHLMLCGARYVKRNLNSSKVIAVN
jgi:hypothetical protein